MNAAQTPMPGVTPDGFAAANTGTAAVSAEAVAWAYRLILGREPESAAAVEDHVRNSESLAALRDRFLESAEFTARFSEADRARGHTVAVWPPCAIESEVDAETAARLFDRIAGAWQRLGETEPYWSVVSDPQYKMDRIDETRDAFLESGRQNAERLFATLRRNDVAIDPEWEVLELGCGLGRTTRWLAPRFRHVAAVDISTSHLRLARTLNADADCAERISWIHLESPTALQQLPGFDLLFSIIVLQHNPPPVIRTFLETLATRLRPGGYAFFQVPTYQRRYAFDVQGYLASHVADGASPEIEMHVLPQADVFRIFHDRGCIPLEVFEDGLSGYGFRHRSNSFLFHKPAAGKNSGMHGVG